jgi:Transposase
MVRRHRVCQSTPSGLASALTGPGPPRRGDRPGRRRARVAAWAVRCRPRRHGHGRPDPRRDWSDAGEATRPGTRAIRHAYSSWLKDKTEEFRAGVKHAALDPFRGYANALRGELSDAVQALDAFHVVKLGTTVLDEVRRRVQQEQLSRRGTKTTRSTRSRADPPRRRAPHRPPTRPPESRAGRRRPEQRSHRGVALLLAAPRDLPRRNTLGRCCSGRESHRRVPILPDPRGRPPRPHAAHLATASPDLLHHRRRDQRRNRSDQRHHREDPPPRPRLPQLHQLPATPAPRRRRLPPLPTTPTQEPMTTLRSKEPVWVASADLWRYQRQLVNADRPAVIDNCSKRHSNLRYPN